VTERSVLLRGFSRQKVSDLLGGSLAPIAGIAMIIGAGGRFKQMLIASGIGDAIGIGAGPLFSSHINDAGFWLVKEYFGMTVGQTIKTWSAMETILSVVGIIFIMLLALVV
jgi:H+/gluconate symporter-like permease